MDAFYYNLDLNLARSNKNASSDNMFTNTYGNSCQKVCEWGYYFNWLVGYFIS